MGKGVSSVHKNQDDGSKRGRNLIKNDVQSLKEWDEKSEVTNDVKNKM